jgi:NAD(P)-dependent dehydrogenase (short-subunit alcohol dehydrogenase family)
MHLACTDGLHTEHLMRKEQVMVPQLVEGKVALITGANKGIGLEIARQLGRQGMTVLISARDVGRGREAAEGLKSAGISAYCIRLDMTSQATIDRAACHIAEEFSKLDILVNNGAAGRTSCSAPGDAASGRADGWILRCRWPPAVVAREGRKVSGAKRLDDVKRLILAGIWKGGN